MVYELIAAVVWSTSYFVKPYILDVRKDADAHLMRFAGAHIPTLRSGSRPESKYQIWLKFNVHIKRIYQLLGGKHWTAGPNSHSDQ